MFLSLDAWQGEKVGPPGGHIRQTQEERFLKIAYIYYLKFGRPQEWCPCLVQRFPKTRDLVSQTMPAVCEKTVD